MSEVLLAIHIGLTMRKPDFSFHTIIPILVVTASSFMLLLYLYSQTQPGSEAATSLYSSVPQNFTAKVVQKRIPSGIRQTASLNSSVPQNLPGNVVQEEASSGIEETASVNSPVPQNLPEKVVQERASSGIEETASLNSSVPRTFSRKVVQKQVLSGTEETSSLNSSVPRNLPRKVVRKQVPKASLSCDIYKGKWVWDERYPLYPSGSCHYMNNVDCAGNGRVDSGYTCWRWQPTDCNIPRMNASDMLERLRGKRLMFVGDSLNRGQYESMLCILATVVPPHRKLLNQVNGTTVFFALDYNVSVEFFWAPFLVEQAVIRNGSSRREILRLDAVESHGYHWKGADVLVFNSAHWWQHYTRKTSRNFFQEGKKLYPELDPTEAYEKALITWSRWMDANIHPSKTRVFFRAVSPTHQKSTQWNKSDSQGCNSETEPITREEFLRPFPRQMQILEKVLSKMRTPVALMNITRMTDFRKDAHPSVYYSKGKLKLTESERRNPRKHGDCSHWCLPGLPDIWNELLYASLFEDNVKPR